MPVWRHFLSYVSSVLDAHPDTFPGIAITFLIAFRFRFDFQSRCVKVCLCVSLSNTRPTWTMPNLLLPAELRRKHTHTRATEPPQTSSQGGGEGGYVCNRRRKRTASPWKRTVGLRLQKKNHVLLAPVSTRKQHVCVSTYYFFLVVSSRDTSRFASHPKLDYLTPCGLYWCHHMTLLLYLSLLTVEPGSTALLLLISYISIYIYIYIHI